MGSGHCKSGGSRLCGALPQGQGRQRELGGTGMKDAHGGGCSDLPERRTSGGMQAQQNRSGLLCAAPVMGTTLLH